MPRVPLPPDWADLPDEALLDVRLCDLPLTIEGTLADWIAQLRQELDSRGVGFPLHLYLSDEWFTPDGATSIAVPFYMAHPRLHRLEEAQMFEVEGGTYDWGMRILRHEAGHAIDNAYRLRRRRQRRETFGPPSTPYPEFYTPKPYSKSFVLHLDSWYAQSHPDEDFAETFAVWLTPDSEWRTRYAGWPAIKKLEYMDALMRSVHGTPVRVDNPEEVEPLRKLRQTLRQHYRAKRRHYGMGHPNFYDRDLRRLFSDAPEYASNMTAAQFIGRVRRPVRRVVASWTGIYQYTIDQVLEEMIARSRELKLRLTTSEDQARQEFTVLLTVQAMNYLHSGGHRLFL
ncbi:MAG TPA: putative zinc-binding metallopeptidase [Vicinamibacterales bacterium]|nr:putative zinc-binding metallopeptidase [Vicinamibacterales bacterium]